MKWDQTFALIHEIQNDHYIFNKIWSTSLYMIYMTIQSPKEALHASEIRFFSWFGWIIVWFWNHYFLLCTTGIIITIILIFKSFIVKILTNTFKCFQESKVNNENFKGTLLPNTWLYLINFLSKSSVLFFNKHPRHLYIWMCSM